MHNLEVPLFLATGDSKMYIHVISTVQPGQRKAWRKFEAVEMTRVAYRRERKRVGSAAHRTWLRILGLSSQTCDLGHVL